MMARCGRQSPKRSSATIEQAAGCQPDINWYMVRRGSETDMAEFMNLEKKTEFGVRFFTILSLY